MPVFHMDTIVPPVSDVSPTICGHISHTLWPYLPKNRPVTETWLMKQGDTRCVNILFRQGLLWDNSSFSLVLLVATRPSFYQEAFQSTDLPQITATNWTHAIYSHSHTHTQKNTNLVNNKPAGSRLFFNHVYSLFIQPTFRCFLNFFTGYTQFAGNSTNTSVNNHAETQRHDTPTHTHTYAYTLCF